MGKFLQGIADRLWPELRAYTDQRRYIGTGDVIATLWALPFAIIGLFWLSSITDINVLWEHWFTFSLLAVIQFIFFRLGYFIIFEIRSDRYASADGSLVSMIQWVAIFLFGPSSIWLSASWMIINFIRNGMRTQSTAARWVLARTATHEIATLTMATLISLIVYEKLGGSYPFTKLSTTYILLGFIPLIIQFAGLLLIWSVYIAFAIRTQRRLAGRKSIPILVHFLVLALSLSYIAHPFAIQAAGIYSQHGIFAFLFFISGLIIVAYLGRQLSWAVESSRQRERQLQQLESLGRAIINAEPDIHSLPPILEQHVTVMFPSARISISMLPDHMLLKNPEDWSMDLQALLKWGCTLKEPHAYLANEPLPWSNPVLVHDPVVISPIKSNVDGRTLGCIYIELRSLSQPWDRRALNNLFPAVKTLADQISSAIHQTQMSATSLELEATRQELRFAGRIQSSFIPNEIPTLDGWEMAVTILPARETSGDFFDVIQLADGKIGLLIADVADKGFGAALYSALCRTLIRTYALEYLEAQPDRVFYSTNERLLQDARANLFVSSFYGIIDPQTNILTYCNAGHNPPYLFSQRRGGRYTPLSATGMPLGVERETTWKQSSIQIEPGDLLVLYTDGIPDSQNEQGEFFHQRRLIDTIKGYLGLSAQDMMVSIIDEVQRFSGNNAQFDDITLLLISRNV